MEVDAVRRLGVVVEPSRAAGQHHRHVQVRRGDEVLLVQVLVELVEQIRKKRALRALAGVPGSSGEVDVAQMPPADVPVTGVAVDDGRSP